MFFGTKLWFKLIYFITAMSPAYILYSFHLYALNEPSIFKETVFKVPIIPVVLIIFYLVFGFIIKKVLIKETERNGNPYSLDITVKEIEDQNGTSLVFLLGVIIPSVIYIDASIFINLLIFIFVQFLLFSLMNNTSTLFPNIILMFFGIHSYKLKSGKYLISNQSAFNMTNKKLQTTLIGDNSNTLCYVAKGR